jgi:hypothetical protein
MHSNNTREIMLFGHFKTIVYHFSVAPLTCVHYFYVTCQYPPRIVFVLRIDILCAFHSTRCTMLEFSMSPLRTKTLCAPLTKLSRDNIYSHCARNYQTPLHYANTARTTCTIIMNVHTMHTSYAYAHCAMLKLSHTPTHKHFSARRPKFSAHTCTLTFFHAVPKFSVCTSMPTFFHAVTNFYIS